MTTERDDGNGPYVPLPPHVVRDIAVGGVTARAFSMPLARELLHLRERTEVHLKLIADLSKQEVSPEHAERLNARVASLVAEVGTLRSQPNELEMANSRLEGDVIGLHEDNAGLVKQNLDLRHQIDEWKAASGLNDASGDPGGIEPRHPVRRIWEDHRRYSLLLRDLDAERKVHASTALAARRVCDKAKVWVQLEAWLGDHKLRSIIIGKGTDWYRAGLSHDRCHIAIGVEASLTAAIDAALRGAEGVA